MRYSFVELHSSRWPVNLQCRVLNVSRNGFYSWRRGEIGTRQAADAQLMPMILMIHESTGHTYGAESIANHTYGAESIAKELRKQRVVRWQNPRATLDEGHGDEGAVQEHVEAQGD